MLPGQHLARIPVDRISPAAEGQARKDFNDERLNALAESLKRSGVREPIIVTPHGAEEGRFQIVAGERRWRAAQLAGLPEIPCIVDPGLADQKDKLLAQAEENLHREDLNPVEEAEVLAQLMELRGVDAREAGALIGRSYPQARRLIQLHTAPAPIKRAVARRQVDGRAALELTRVFNKMAREDSTPERTVALRRIEKVVERVAREKWTFRRLERYAAKFTGRGGEDEDAALPTGQGLSEDTSGSAEATASPVVKAPPSREQGRGALVLSVDGRISIDARRVERGEMSPEERETLIALLEKLLGQTRRA
jgi:ParB/RepB/Spo0J family partition protein